MTEGRDDVRVRDALAAYFRREGLPADGGYRARWVRLPVGPFAVYAPNIPARRAAVRYHDVHHLLTGYHTTWRGEAEIGAWEVGSGCKRVWVAWLLDSQAVAFGALLWPRATFRAFCRGRRCRNLFGEDYARLGDEPVGVLRHRLGLDARPPEPTVADRFAFAGAAAAGAVLGLAQLAVPVAAVAALVAWST